MSYNCPSHGTFACLFLLNVKNVLTFVTSSCGREVTAQARGMGAAVHRQPAGHVTGPAAQRRPSLTRAQHAGHPYAFFAPSGKVWVQLVQFLEQLEVTAMILCFDPVRGRTFACRVSLHASE